MRTVRLTEGEIAEQLGHLPEWTRVGQTILRTYQLESFAQSMKFVNQVAEEAGRVDHHPDMDIRYDKSNAGADDALLEGPHAERHVSRRGL